ncbi:MAG: glyoxalase [Akkermansiaceae bacterium]|nr:glyoxalase [Akkermansiaceae bacterium]
MQVERVKYVIWAADLARATRFYQETFGAEVTRSSSAMTELEIAGAIIGIHGGGEGKRTWTGISIQVADVVTGAAEVIANGGGLVREPAEEDGETPHLAMCFDTDGNEFMLIRKR